MARETAEQFAARIAEDNRLAALVAPGTTIVDIGRTMVLGPKVEGEQIDGWDIYEVKHSGFNFKFSSASVAATFGKGA